MIFINDYWDRYLIPGEYFFIPRSLVDIFLSRGFKYNPGGVYNVQYTINPGSVYNVLYRVYNILYNVYNKVNNVYNILYHVYNIQYTVSCIQ